MGKFRKKMKIIATGEKELPISSIEKNKQKMLTSNLDQNVSSMLSNQILLRSRVVQ